MVKICRSCQRELPVEDFPKATYRRDGLYSYCKACSREKKRISREKNPTTPERTREYKRRYREKHPERLKQAERRRALRRKFDITVEEYDEMFAAQGGVCAICSEPPDTRMLAVDHCHQTGRIRGLLCSNCNTALGLLDDDPVRIARLLKYAA